MSNKIKKQLNPLRVLNVRGTMLSALHVTYIICKNAFKNPVFHNKVCLGRVSNLLRVIEQRVSQPKLYSSSQGAGRQTCLLQIEGRWLCGSLRLFRKPLLSASCMQGTVLAPSNIQTNQTYSMNSRNLQPRVKVVEDLNKLKSQRIPETSY